MFAVSCSTSYVTLTNAISNFSFLKRVRRSIMSPDLPCCRVIRIKRTADEVMQSLFLVAAMQACELIEMLSAKGCLKQSFSI